MTTKDDKEELRVPLVEEQLAVEKDRRSTGITRVQIETHEETRTLELPVVHEEVVVERVPIGRVVAAAAEPRLEGDMWFIPVYEERVVSTKQLVLKEEVRVRKLQTKDLVHHEEVVRTQEPRVTGPTSRQTTGGRVMRTIVAMFEDRTAAEAAANALSSKGIGRERLHIDASGNAILGVECGDDEVNLVESTLESYNPIDIETRSEAWKSQGWTGFDPSAPPLKGRAIDRDRELIKDAEQRIPIAEERLRVGKEAVRTGGVRIRSYVEEVPVSQDVELASERVSVERRPATGDLGEAAFDEKAIEVETFSEEPVVQKEARVVEEVVVKKDVDVRKETVKDTVRRTQVEVDDESKRDPNLR
jgi:uncharacterized protein (TIGR02271 family)